MLFQGRQWEFLGVETLPTSCLLWSALEMSWREEECFVLFCFVFLVFSQRYNKLKISDQTRLIVILVLAGSS